MTMMELLVLVSMGLVILGLFLIGAWISQATEGIKQVAAAIKASESGIAQVAAAIKASGGAPVTNLVGTEVSAMIHLPGGMASADGVVRAVFFRGDALRLLLEIRRCVDYSLPGLEFRTLNATGALVEAAVDDCHVNVNRPSETRR